MSLIPEFYNDFSNFHCFDCQPVCAVRVLLDDHFSRFSLELFSSHLNSVVAFPLQESYSKSPFLLQSSFIVSIVIMKFTLALSFLASLAYSKEVAIEQDSSVRTFNDDR